MINVKSFEDYIALQDEKHQETLIELMSLVEKIIPNAIEKMSYGVCCYYHYYMLVGFGVTKKHCSMYVMSSNLAKEIIEKYKNLKIKGTTIHLEPGKPLPKKEISQIIKFRVKENEEKYKKKKNKK